MNSYYSDFSAENPFGREHIAPLRTPGLREHLAAGHSITTFPRQARVGGADINAIIDRYLAKKG